MASWRMKIYHQEVLHRTHGMWAEVHVRVDFLVWAAIFGEKLIRGFTSNGGVGLRVGEGVASGLGTSVFHASVTTHLGRFLHLPGQATSLSIL